MLHSEQKVECRYNFNFFNNERPSLRYYIPYDVSEHRDSIQDLMDLMCEDTLNLPQIDSLMQELSSKHTDSIKFPNKETEEKNNMSIFDMIS